MWCLRWTIKLCGWLSSVVTSLHLKLPKHWKLKWTWYMPPTRRLNAEQPQQNYSLSSSTNVAMHGRIIMSRGGSGGRRSSRTGRRCGSRCTRSRDAATDAAGAVSVTAAADVVLRGLTVGDSDETSGSNRPEWRYESNNRPLHPSSVVHV